MDKGAMGTRSWLRSLVLVILALTTGPSSIKGLELACVPNHNYEELWREHKYVMVGRVTDYSRASTVEESLFTVSAIRVWKGKKRVLRLRNTGGVDGLGLAPGRVYVIFANDDPQAMATYCYPAFGVWKKEGQNAVGRLDRLRGYPALTLPDEDVQPR